MKNTILIFISLLSIVICFFTCSDLAIATKDNNNIILISFLIILFTFWFSFLVFTKIRNFIIKHFQTSVILTIALMFILSASLYFLNSSFGVINTKKVCIKVKYANFNPKSSDTPSYYLVLSDSIFKNINIKKSFYHKLKERDTLILRIRNGILGYSVLVDFYKYSIQKDSIIEISP